MSRKKPIDTNYFKNYAGSKRSYSDVYLDHSGISECIELFKDDDAPKVRKLFVLGAATGEVLEDFYHEFKIYPYGCEISEWAYERISKKFRKRIENKNLIDWVREQKKLKGTFDLGFSNSLVYLEKNLIPSVIKDLSKISRFIHFDSSTTGNACPDPYRKTLKPYSWWQKKFKEGGFIELTSVFGSRTYLWQSVSLNRLSKKR